MHTFAYDAAASLWMVYFYPSSNKPGDRFEIAQTDKPFVAACVASWLNGGDRVPSTFINEVVWTGAPPAGL